MDQPDEVAPHRRPRRQLSCVQCRRRKVKCDHERPCKRCRIRGWNSQCTYPLDIPLGPGDPTSVVSSPRRTSIGRDLHSASPRIANRPSGTNPLSQPASTYGSPSGPADIATPESLSGAAETLYGFLPGRSSYPSVPQRTLSEPGTLATPISTSPHTLPRAPSVVLSHSSERNQDQNRPKSTQDDGRVAKETPDPREDSEYALYLNNGESVYFGRSSAPWLISKFGNIMSYIHAQDRLSCNERISFIRMKRLTSQHLMVQDQEEIPPSGLAAEVPPREISDLLVTNYFTTFERLYPLFDAATFWREYESFWEAPTQARLVFVIILLLVICTGNSTLPNDLRPISRCKIVRWWRLGLTWQSAAAETNERMITTLQASCLIANLRQVYSLSETAEWVSSGSLVKNAIAMGLHRDPLKLRDIPPEDHELRRRVFYTVLELDLQFCLNAGMLPTIRLGDWDTRLPEITSDVPVRCPGAPNQIPINTTQEPISVQTRMLNSFKTRVEIACSANAIIPEDNYDKILDLTNQLNEAFHGLECEPRSCQTEILKSVYNRYLLTLHIPFAIAGNPKFAFSQNVCLTSALSILEQMTLPPPPSDTTADSPSRPNSTAHQPSIDHADLVCITSMHTSGILFKNAGFYAALYLCHELIRDDDPSLTSSSSSSSTSSSSTPHHSAKPYTTPFLSMPRPRAPPNLVRALPAVKDRVVALIESFVKIAEERLRTTQFAGKAFLIPRMALAYQRISEDREVRTREEKERRLLEAGKVIAEICFSIFCSNPDVARMM